MSHLVVGHACLDITMSRILRALRPQINSGALANGSIIGSVRPRCSFQSSFDDRTINVSGSPSCIIECTAWTSSLRPRSAPWRCLWHSSIFGWICAVRVIKSLITRVPGFLCSFWFGCTLRVHRHPPRWGAFVLGGGCVLNCCNFWPLPKWAQDAC